MAQSVAGWPPPAGGHLELPARPVGAASAEYGARYRVVTPCCGRTMVVPLGPAKELAWLETERPEPVWIQCGRTFDLRRGRGGCDADRAFDPVLAPDGTLVAVRWRPPTRPAG